MATALAIQGNISARQRSARVHPTQGSPTGPSAAIEDREDPNRRGDGWVVPTENRSESCLTKNLVIDPRSTFIKNWEYQILVLLLFTSTVTPFEVAFLEVSIDALFFINRIVDCLFLVDLLIQFNLGYFESGGNKQPVYQRSKIAARYIFGWFLVDVISIVPFDIIGFVVGSEAVSRLKILRILRLLRLFKLVKLLRSAEMITKLQSRLGFKYSMMSLCKYMMIILFVSHWIACLWHVVTVLEDENVVTWVVSYFCAGVPSGCNPSIAALYCASLYHATMTITTIGYGDLVATTTTERWVSVAIQLLGASLYAYIVGVASGIVASMNKEKMHFQETMDELNDFMEDQQLSTDLSARLREYFQHLRSVQKMRLYASLLQKMSPALRGEVANLAYGEMIQSVSYFNGVGESFVTQIALVLEAMVLSSGELVVAEASPVLHLYFVAEGQVIANNRMESIGYFFGEEVIMETGTHKSSVRAVSYCNLYTLSREKLYEVLEKFPRVQKIIRRAVMRLAFRRDVLQVMLDLRKGADLPKSTLLKGVAQLQSELRAKDQKIKALLEESVVLQEQLMKELPQCKVYSRILMNDAEERRELKSIIDEQSQYSVSDSNEIRGALHKFWRTRRALSNTHMILANDTPVASPNFFPKTDPLDKVGAGVGSLEGSASTLECKEDTDVPDHDEAVSTLLAAMPTIEENPLPAMAPAAVVSGVPVDTLQEQTGDVDPGKTES